MNMSGTNGCRIYAMQLFSLQQMLSEKVDQQKDLLAKI
jgi:hypothetical protein